MQNDINDASTVVYNEARMKALRDAWGDGWHSAFELFVNGNEPNVKDVTQESFQELVSYDTINEQAFPLFVYQKGTQMVGWYDRENVYGYVALHSK